MIDAGHLLLVETRRYKRRDTRHAEPIKDAEAKALVLYTMLQSDCNKCLYNKAGKLCIPGTKLILTR